MQNSSICCFYSAFPRHIAFMTAEIEFLFQKKIIPVVSCWGLILECATNLKVFSFYLLLADTLIVTLL